MHAVQSGHGNYRLIVSTSLVTYMETLERREEQAKQVTFATKAQHDLLLLCASRNPLSDG
jgi:hypothetical protein